MPIYHPRTRGTSGGEVVRHADASDRRTRRRLPNLGRLPGSHRATPRRASARVSPRSGLMLLLVGACAVLMPLAAVTLTVGPPPSFRPLWPLFGRHDPSPRPRLGDVPGVTTPDGPPPGPSGVPAADAPSDGPDAPTNPPARPGPSPPTVFVPPLPSPSCSRTARRPLADSTEPPRESEVIQMGGKPNPGTKKDGRLKGNPGGKKSGGKKYGK